MTSLEISRYIQHMFQIHVSLHNNSKYYTMNAVHLIYILYTYLEHLIGICYIIRKIGHSIQLGFLYHLLSLFTTILVKLLLTSSV